MAGGPQSPPASQDESGWRVGRASALPSQRAIDLAECLTNCEASHIDRERYFASNSFRLSLCPALSRRAR